MMRDCVEPSGGDLEIDSTMGQGTCIRIVLPLSRGSVRAHEALGRMLHRSNAEGPVMATVIATRDVTRYKPLRHGL